MFKLLPWTYKPIKKVSGDEGLKPIYFLKLYWLQDWVPYEVVKMFNIWNLILADASCNKLMNLLFDYKNNCRAEPLKAYQLSFINMTANKYG